MRIIVSVLLFLSCGSALPVWAEPDEIGKKKCKECHRFSLHDKKLYKGPDLFFAGNKFYKNWLTKFLQSPMVIREVNVFSGSNLLREESKAIDPHVALKKEESERVANFLMTLRLPNLELEKVNEEPLSKGESARAKVLFEKIESGSVKIEIFKRYKLDDVITAHQDLENRKILGPAVIIPN